MINSEEARRITEESLLVDNHSRIVNEELDMINDYIRYSAEKGKSTMVFEFKDESESARENKKVREVVLKDLEDRGFKVKREIILGISVRDPYNIYW